MLQQSHTQGSLPLEVIYEPFQIAVQRVLGEMRALPSRREPLQQLLDRLLWMAARAAQQAVKEQCKGEAIVLVDVTKTVAAAMEAIPLDGDEGDQYQHLRSAGLVCGVVASGKTFACLISGFIPPVA